MTLTEAIGTRHSVRNYLRSGISEQMRSRLDALIAGAGSPFGSGWQARLLTTDGSDFKPSTYGFITGATEYIAIGIADDHRALLSAGYAMERVVLEATAMGLGTCWIAGTFKHSNFSTAAGFDAATPLFAVIAVGVPGRSGLVNKIARAVVRSDKRRPMAEMFFSGSPGTPLAADSPWYRPLQLMRAAPSSTNSQPWRAVVSPDNRRIDFYNAATRDMSWLDMGIGLCHFDIGAEAGGITGHFAEADDAARHTGLTYITTYITD